MESAWSVWPLHVLLSGSHPRCHRTKCNVARHACQHSHPPHQSRLDQCRRVCCSSSVLPLPSLASKSACQSSYPASSSCSQLPRIDPLSTSQWLLICCCCIPCRSENAPGSSVLRCQCSRCPLEQQPDRPVHGRLADVLVAVWSRQTSTQSVSRPRRHGRQTAVPSSSMGNGACLDRQRVNAPACLSAACLLSARLVGHASQTATTTLFWDGPLDGLLHGIWYGPPRRPPEGLDQGELDHIRADG
ncbi:hypothetical protein BC831DRAFT_11872 [Entophlyctis helioformis]|nr:hypothetical protein BC831DRAFT_11872 [Entophlyctis helioformis]